MKEPRVSIIHQLPRALLDDHEFYKEICSRMNPFSVHLRDLPKDLHSEKVYDNAIAEDGMSLRYLPRDSITLERCHKAVNQDGRALAYVPNEMKSLELCWEALKNNAKAILNVTREMRENNKDMWQFAITREPTLSTMIPAHLKESVLEMVEQHKSHKREEGFQKISTELKAIRDEYLAKLTAQKEAQAEPTVEENVEIHPSVP